jgi:hypothetical protein
VNQIQKLVGSRNGNLKGQPLLPVLLETQKQSGSGSEALKEVFYGMYAEGIPTRISVQA